VPVESLSDGAARHHWPVMIDRVVAQASNHLRIPSGTDGMSIVISADDLVKAMDARTGRVALSDELHREEPHFVLYDDGIRSLDPDKEHLLIDPMEIYFPEVAQSLSIGSSEEHMDALHRMIAVAKQRFDKPSAKDIATAHYAFLKER